MLRTVPRAKQWITVESLPEGCYGQSAEDDGEPAPPGAQASQEERRDDRPTRRLGGQLQNDAVGFVAFE